MYFKTIGTTIEILLSVTLKTESYENRNATFKRKRTCC
jgi:hypothetical protein